MPRKRTANGAPQLAKRPESPCWQIRYYDAERRKVALRSTGTEDIEEAQAALAEFLGSGNQTQPPADPVPDIGVTLFGVLDAYYAEYAANLPSAQQAKAAISHLKEILGDIQVSTLDVKTQQTYVGRRDEDEIKASTISRELSVLRSALYYAKEGGRVGEIPQIYDLPPSEPRCRWLTPAEVDKLVNACMESTRYRHVALYVLLGVTTAARPEALLDLQWDQVDLNGGIIHLNPNGRAQTTKFRPIVRMTEQLRAALETAKADRETDYVIEWAGYPVGSIKKAFASAAERAGLSDVTPYTLRHTAATWMAQRGVSLWEIAGFLGHKDTRMVQRHYAHHHPDYQKNASKAVAETLAEAGIATQLRPKERNEANRMRRQKRRNPQVSLGVSMVGAAGIEPATPTMST